MFLSGKKWNSELGSGFALIEILIAVAVIGLLTTSATMYLPEQLKKTRDAQRKFDVSQLGKMLEEHYDSNGCYPQGLPWCGLSLYSGSQILIKSMPCDPLTKSTYYYETMISDCSKSYRLYATLEREDDPAIFQAGCEEGCGPTCIFNYGVSSPNTSLDFCEVIVPTDIMLPTTVPLPATPTPLPTTVLLTETPSVTMSPTPTLIDSQGPTHIPVTPGPSPTPIPHFCYSDPPYNPMLRILWYLVCWILYLMKIL